MQFEIDFEASHLEHILAAARREIASPEGKEWKPLSAMKLAEDKPKGGPLKKTAGCAFPAPAGTNPRRLADLLPGP
ncbi:hypothetical protein [Methylomonas koyamae]|uniref:hypothetical protein n=1 Tax=Methylomonas koyamae TaxID=702114 RepID=UPI001127BDAC|nr:hypothetical protein [Methylomonas koyamae]TPQ24220.1 hypothetical protein C2U68_20840 [Methylomonas koyamae]